MTLTYARKLQDGSIEYSHGRSVTLADGTAVTHPTRDQYVAAGWKVVMDGPPPKREPPEGKEWEKVGLFENGDLLVPRWRLVDKATPPPPPPRVFVTADVIEALMKAGVWPQVRAFIEKRGMLDMVLATKEFRADDPNFTGPRDALKEQLGWTDEDVEAVLAAAEAGAA